MDECDREVDHDKKAKESIDPYYCGSIVDGRFLPASGGKYLYKAGTFSDPVSDHWV